MKRRLFNLATVVSLGMMLAIVVLWVRGLRDHSDQIWYVLRRVYTCVSFNGRIYQRASRAAIQVSVSRPRSVPPPKGGGALVYFVLAQCRSSAMKLEASGSHRWYGLNG